MRGCKDTARRFGNLRYDVGIPSCQQKNCCALSALDGNGRGKPRALPWAVMWRPFRPCIRTAILEKGGHGFSVDGTAQGLRYDVGMPSCQQKNCCALTALDGNGGGKPRALPWAVMWRPFRPCIRTAILEKGGHGFSVDGTAQGLRYDVGMPSCQQKNCCALSALDGNGGGKPRALPWAVRLRPFRPALCGVILDEESHGFSVDGTAQGLRYGRRGSLRYNGLPWFCRFHYEISGLIPKSRVPGQAGSTREGARGRG